MRTILDSTRFEHTDNRPGHDWACMSALIVARDLFGIDEDGHSTLSHLADWDRSCCSIRIKLESFEMVTGMAGVKCTYIFAAYAEKYDRDDDPDHETATLDSQTDREVATEKETLFYLQNRTAGFIGNAPLFWANSSGYTQWIAEARLFTESECKSRVAGSIGSHKWIMWPEGEIRGNAKQTVDTQDLDYDKAIQ